MKRLIKVLLACILVCMSVIFVGCGANVPNSPERAKMKMQALGYNVTVKELDEDEYGVGVVALVQVVKKTDVSVSMSAILFKKPSQARSFMKDFEDGILAYDKENLECVGRWILQGSSEARDDFKSK